MFKPAKATNVKEYLESIPEERKKTIAFLHDYIQNVSPELKNHFAYNYHIRIRKNRSERQ